MRPGAVDAPADMHRMQVYEAAGICLLSAERWLLCNAGARQLQGEHVRDFAPELCMPKRR